MTQSEHSNLINTRLNDRNLIKFALGEGCMGVVYRAHDTLIECEAVIKVTTVFIEGYI